MVTAKGVHAGPISPRERVKRALGHKAPDRVPVDFLAVPEVWNRLVAELELGGDFAKSAAFFDPRWEKILRYFEVDCRLISYDQFCRPPASTLREGAAIDWWGALSRSTPNRMWRQVTSEGDLYDIWGHHIHVVEHPNGAYESFAGWPLGGVRTLSELKSFPWPEPDWWDFSELPQLLEQLDLHEQYHIRFRIGSVFEIAWQLRGLEAFMMDLAVDPSIPNYIMDRLTEVHVENTRRALELASGRLDMVYFYDDVATQQSLMISKAMWRNLIKPKHVRLIEAAKGYKGTSVMYHCDGAIRPLVPELIDMGVDLLNPIQADARGMEPAKLKAEFGNRLSFHGGIDIIKTLPRGTVADVQNEVSARVQTLGRNGGYVLASSHHIQPDTPSENIEAMYDIALRYQNH